MTTLEKWKSALDKRENICVLFMDLSKAFDTKNSDLFLAKLKAYRLSINALDLMRSYLKNRRQSVQINNNLSSAKKVHPRVFPRVPLTLLFTLFINNSVSISTDDNNLYSTGKDRDNKKSAPKRF